MYLMNNTIVILANSVKNRAHCVAGKCIRTRQWIRPVGDANGCALSDSQIQVTNPKFRGSYSVKPLQKINMRFLGETPLINQPENRVIDNTWTWTQSYNIHPSQLSFYLDNPEDLWGTGDSLPYSQIQNGQIIISNSLYLVKVNNLNLYYDESYGRKRRKATFFYKGFEYTLSVTDPNFDKIINSSEYYSESILCISLGEPWEQNNCCYKLIATIFAE